MIDPRITIGDAELGHIDLLAAELRPEMMAAVALTGRPAGVVMRECFRASVMRRTAFMDGAPVAMWGCAGALLGGVGEGWLFASVRLQKVPRSTLWVAGQELARFRSVFREMRGILFSADQAACRFAAKIGCEIKADGAGAGPFLRYEVTQ